MTDKELLVLAEQVEAHLALAEHTKTDSSLAVKKVRPLVIEIVGDLRKRACSESKPKLTRKPRTPRKPKQGEFVGITKAAEFAGAEA
mgnify:FL=1|jgi:hypothetical protein